MVEGKPRSLRFLFYFKNEFVIILIAVFLVVCHRFIFSVYVFLNVICCCVLYVAVCVPTVYCMCPYLNEQMTLQWNTLLHVLSPPQFKQLEM